MTLEEFDLYCERYRKFDNELDDYQLKILKKGNVIVEGRITGWLAYRSKISAFKVMLDADIETRARRIVKRENGGIEKRKHELLAREKSEAKRYKNYYDIDLKDDSIYDLVINSTDKTPAEIVEIITRKLEE